MLMKLSSPGFCPSRLSGGLATILRCVAAVLLALVAICTSLIPAHAVTINWVTVGDPGNTADTTGDPNPAGAVADAFRIMKYEWTNSQYVDFLNAVDPDGLNPQGIYNATMGSNARGGISFTSGNAAGSKYAARTNMGDKPVNYVSWFDAARVANWLHNGGLTYETTGTTASAPQNTGAYTLGTATSGTSFTRNLGATFYIPTEDQWYKAAYYKGDGTNVGYWDYATQSDTAPTAVTSGSTGIGSAGNTGNFANFSSAADWNGQNGNVTTVGTNGGVRTEHLIWAGTSGNGMKRLSARLVGCGAAPGSAAARSPCRPPAGTRPPRRARTTSSVFVSQVRLPCPSHRRG
jgi:hypothetical protein